MTNLPIKKYFILGVLSVRLCIFADVKEVKPNNLIREQYSYKEVCTQMGIKDALLISKVSKKKIDCMGKIYSISDFCYSKFSESRDYIFSEFDLVDKKVNCNFASQVQVSFECDNKYKEICKDPKKGCLALGKLFARNLESFKSSKSQTHPAILKCFFAKTENEKILKSLL